MRKLPVLFGVAFLGSLVALLNCGDDDGTAGSPPGTDAGSTPPVTPPTGTTTPQPPPATGDAAPPGHVAFALDDSAQLVRFTTGAPGSAAAIAITGLTGGSSLVGIDFRPSTGALYGFGDDATLYTIDTTTGVATAVDAAADAGATTFPVVLDPTATSYGFDFNPAADRIRVHNDKGQNYRLHPANGQSVNVTSDGELAYADGGPTVAAAGAAYINSVQPKPATTTLFGIDPERDQLTRFANASGGVTGGFAEATPVGPLGVDADLVAGFDIFGGMSDPDGGAPPTNTAVEAFAAMTVGGQLGLYTIDLTTGAATLVGAIGHDKPLRGIAIQP